MLKKLLMACACFLPTLVQAESIPKIAVTDLAYEEKVSHYFHVTSYKNKERLNASSRGQESAYGASGSERVSASSDTEYFEASGDFETIERGELRKFTGDIKGEMLKSGVYRLVQARPYTAKENEKLYDVIDRIKKGYFPNADYVLFNTITSIDPRSEENPIQGSNAVNHSLSLELVVESSLINTKTYEVKAAFSAMGEGSDSRLVNMVGQKVQLSKARVMKEVSESLGKDVARQLEEQFIPGGTRSRSSRSQSGSYNSIEVRQREEVVTYN
ncbi:hypothetical protein LIN78_10925 [Leeia sp. TBRC 13508]|uniref:Uncharacterized protein n=1 Tax=Leeia speluncae TaxID=2884804 RepID=A0ABS8D788_9NEIS|nr:hypothetical protein [Leeia speluncae]MCB6184058.1 hypothetical protein [Leeia speluncae]